MMRWAGAGENAARGGVRGADGAGEGVDGASSGVVAMPKDGGEAVAVPGDAPRDGDDAGLGASVYANERWMARLITLVLFALIAVLKILYNLKVDYFGLDGSYYANVAGHVRDGEGLVTDLSLYHSGMPFFPHPTPIYPLWPLVLGYVSRAVPLEWAAVWLPTFLFGLTLVWAAKLALSVDAKPLVPAFLPGLNAGHLAILMLGLNRYFFTHTSVPYTEALAYALLMPTLLRAKRLFDAPALWRGLEVGVWMGLLVLVRSQLLIVFLAFAATVIIWMAVRPSRVSLGVGALGAIGFFAVLGAQYLHLRATLGPVNPGILLRFDHYRATEFLSPLKVMVRTDGVWDWLRDRAQGIPLAFAGFGRYSYDRSIGMFSAALPLALPFVAWDVHRRRLWRHPWRRSVALARSPGGISKIFLILFAAAGLLSLHTFHKAVFFKWNFGSRHALTAVFAFFGATLYLARRPPWGRVLTIYILCVGLFVGVTRITKRIHHDDELHAWGRTHASALVSWIDAHKTRPRVTIAAPRVQRLAHYVHDANLHWIYPRTSPADLQALIERFDLDLLLLPTGDDDYDFLDDPGWFNARFLLVRADVSGYDVYLSRRASSGNVSPSVPGGPDSELPNTQ